MTRTRIKMCGMTRREDVLAAAQAGADAIGLVFTRRSTRCVEPAHAAKLRAAVPPMVSIVALFMDDDAEFVRAVERAVRPHVLQFHGNEPAAFCESFDTPYIKTIAMASVHDLDAQWAAYPRAVGFLLDGHGAGETGGSGKHFDWSRVPHDTDRPLVVAGGLHAGNVEQAVRVARSWAVDVSSGIESAPGIKDAGRMRDFVAAVRAADRALEADA